MRAILEGQPYPASLLNAEVIRCKTEAHRSRSSSIPYPFMNGTRLADLVDLMMPRSEAEGYCSWRASRIQDTSIGSDGLRPSALKSKSSNSRQVKGSGATSEASAQCQSADWGARGSLRLYCAARDDGLALEHDRVVRRLRRIPWCSLCTRAVRNCSHQSVTVRERRIVNQL